MTDLSIQGVGGVAGVKVDIPVVSDEYQAYLDALKKREKLREDNGGDTSEGVELVRAAVKEVDKLAIAIYKNERSN